MTTATLENKPAAEAAPEVPAWKPPRPRVGQQVLFYPDGEVIETRPPDIAFVTKTGEKAIEIKTAGGMAQYAVSHVSDPRLKNPNRRLNGAWDFIEADKELATRLAALEGSLKAMEEKYASLKLVFDQLVAEKKSK